MEKGLSKGEIISELAKSPHGELKGYVKVGLAAAREDQDFFAHLISWNHTKGEVRDAKVALPVLALLGAREGEYAENALAHLADLNPRMLVRALDFAREVGAPTRVMRRLVERYLRDLEANFGQWERVAIQHRESLKTLYARYHIKPDARFDAVLFKGIELTPKFKALKALAGGTPEEIAGALTKHKLPFLVVRGALGARAKDPDVLCAVIARMTPAELVTNMKALEKLGVKDVPAARAALEKALEKAAGGKASLKVTRAAESVEDEQLQGKLRVLQEKQLDSAKGIEGDWLILGDRSPSMGTTVELAKEVASVMARLVRGKVDLVFFDSVPQGFEVRGKTLEEIKALTRGVKAGGNGTSIGAGLQWALDKGKVYDGIAIVSDGGENCPPLLGQVFGKYCQKLGVEPTVYWYQTLPDDVAYRGYALQSEVARFVAGNPEMQKFDLTGGKVDYYSLPNLVQTMRVGRYGLLEEVMNQPLRTLDEVLDRTRGQRVLVGKEIASVEV